MKTLSIAVVSAILFSDASLANAAGLGDLTVLSSLGQPLRAEIELISTAKDADGPLNVKLASYESFRQANIEFHPALMSLRFAIEPRGNRQVIRVTSTQPLNEPFIDMLLELGSSNGKLVREYVFLLDPSGPPSDSGGIVTAGAPVSMTANAGAADAAAKESAPTPAPAKPKPRPMPAARTGAPSGGKPRLTLSSVSAVSSQGAEQPTEDYASMEKAVAEANARVKALEQKVGDLQKLLEVTNSLLAELQKQNTLRNTGTVAPEASASAAVESRPANLESDAPSMPATVASAPPVVAAPAATPPKPAVIPKPVLPPTEPDTGLFDEPLLLPGAALLAAALGVGGLYAYRRRKSTQAFDAGLFVHAGKSPDTQALAAETAGTGFHSTYSLLDRQSHINEVDAISEADVYIAYGRDVQAEEVLKEALRTQPERHAVRVKLLSIYAARKDDYSFDQLARELFGLTQGAGDDWAQAASMGRSIDPGNPLYAVTPADQEPARSAAADLSNDDGIPAADELPIPDAASPDSALPDASTGEMLQQHEADALRMLSQPVPAHDQDFDLESLKIDEAEVPAIPALEPDTPAAQANPNNNGPMDFDFVLPEIPALAEPEADAPADTVPQLDSLDFDFVLPKVPVTEKT